jgi:preprotein translocase subunit Sss1
LLSEEQQTAWNISKEELEKNIKAGTIGFSFIQGLPAGFLISLLSAYLLKKE